MVTSMHFSEMATLASCERKWAYRYALGSDEEAGHAAHLGTLLHVGTASWLNGDGVELPARWDAPSHTNGAEPGDREMYLLADFAPEVVAKARWLLNRYQAHYGSVPPSHWNVISTEQWLTAETPWGTLAGTADAIVEIDGELWLIEHKSYGAKGRLDWVQIDPQLGVYDLLVEANYGKPAFGILFDGIYTYRWVPKQRTLADIKLKYPKTTRDVNIMVGEVRAETTDEYSTRIKEIQASEPGIERDPSESFQREYVDLSDAHRDATRDYLAATVRRRDTLAADAERAVSKVAGDIDYDFALLRGTIPNIGRQCSYCDFKPRCWSELGGVDPVDVEVEDEDAEPM